MRVLVCGSRDWLRYDIIRNRLALLGELIEDAKPNPNWPITVIDGGARGADTLGNTAANELGYRTERFPADWKKFGKRAGAVRNAEMLERGKPDLVLAFWDGQSRGTGHMIEIARQAGIPVEIHNALGRVEPERPALDDPSFIQSQLERK